MPEATERTAVVVGAGLAGGNVAVTLREEGWKGRVILLGDEPGIPFGRPPLSKGFLRREIDLSDWLVKPAGWYEANAVERLTGVTVRTIDTTAKQVVLADGNAIGYDALFLCTGGHNRRLTIAGASLRGVYQLRTVAESQAIQAAARPGMKAVIVGMGFIGSEVAASLRQMGLEVTGVVSGRAPLANVLGDAVADVMASIHRDHDVSLVVEDRVVGFDGATAVQKVRTARGTELDCDLVVVGTGIEPTVDAILNTAIRVDNGVLVDERCRTDLPGVYAAGDVANHLHPIFGRLRVEHYNNAEKQGRAAARSALGSDQPYDYIHSFWSDQYEHKLEYVGFAKSWDQLVIRGSLNPARFLAFYLDERGVLIAACGLNRGGDPELEADSDMRACQALITLRARPSASDLANEDVKLQSLAVPGTGQLL
jgi:3-phenylpropionate/trans-cinnamate dioxygenase ferredoxin reductase component